VAGEGGAGEGGPDGGEGDEDGQVPGLPDELLADVGDAIVHPTQSPLFYAEHSERYERQRLIGIYEETFSCRLIVMVDLIYPYSINVFEELIFDADATKDLHLLLASPGGDGETALRLVRSAQARCKELTVIVPDQAKSAGTLLVMGAHRILMGPASDLGPVDPQFQVGEALVSAKDIIAAVESAEAAVQAHPETYALHAALLSDVTGLMVQQGRSALARTGDQLEEALLSNPDRTPEMAKELSERLQTPLIDTPKSHAAIFGAAAAQEAGLPVEQADPTSDQWQLIWRLWIKYWALDQRIYEGTRASKVVGMPRGF
jgi:Serine dehydrogenase proteinase